MDAGQTTPARTESGERPGNDAASPGTASWPRRFWQRSAAVGRELVSLAGGAIAILTVVLVAAIVVESLVEKTVTIQPLSVPKALSDDGISPEVVALKLRDDMNRHVDDVSRDRGWNTTEVMDPEELPDIAVPSVGVSAQALAAEVRAFFKIQNRTVISGEIVSRGDSYSMTLRLNGRPVFRSPHGHPRDHLDDMIGEGVRAALQVTQPIVAATVAYDDGDRRGALALCDGMIGKGRSPLDLHARALKAQVLASLGRVPDALAERRTIVELYPKAPGAHNDLGVALVRLDRRDEAAAEFRAALALAPKYPNAHTNLGKVLLSLGRTDEAMKELDTGVADGPRFFYPHLALANALRAAGRNDEALEQYRTAAPLSPDRAEPHRELGEAFSALGQQKDAAFEYRRLVTLDPASADDHRRLALALDDLGRGDEAAAEREAADRAERAAAPRPTGAAAPPDAGGG